MPGKKELPDTLKRSPKKAQETWIKTHDSAVETYGEGERAHRTAFASLKHEFEKVGDHWEPKGHKGPSDPKAARPYGEGGESFGGVDYLGSTKKELLDRAKELHVEGTSKMDKRHLAEAIAKKQK